MSVAGWYIMICIVVFHKSNSSKLLPEISSVLHSYKSLYEAHFNPLTTLDPFTTVISGH